jgi:hypothetical protein
LTLKALPGAVIRSNFGKTSIGSYKGFTNEKKIKKIFYLTQIFFLILRSPRTTRNNRSSPHNGPIKILPQNLIIYA